MADALGWLGGLLEQRVLGGERFAPGDSVQLGWMYTLIQERPDGHLAICEPDFLSLPVAWDEGVGRTLHHLLIQREVGASADVADVLEFPSYRMSASCAQNCEVRLTS